jgi:hypothetical protein
MVAMESVFELLAVYYSERHRSFGNQSLRRILDHRVTKLTSKLSNLAEPGIAGFVPNVETNSFLVVFIVGR